MNRTKVLLGIAILLSPANHLHAEHSISESPQAPRNIWQRQTLSNGFFGPSQSLANTGIESQLGTTHIYQQNVRGGISKHRRAGRFAGSYDLELSADLGKLLGIEGASLYMLSEGVWSKSAGIDGPSVGSTFGVNADARQRRSIDITELWYEHALLDGSLRIRLGKMDLTGGFQHHGCPVAFDCSTYANDETTQFLNGALVNNPTIPFPDHGLGVAVHYSPAGSWYASAAVADAQADIRETGFKTAFHGADHFFYIVETGLTPRFYSKSGSLPGAYRAGFWYDPRDKERLSGGKTRRDDTGFYSTLDQMLWKENNNVDDTQGLGLFGRFGWAGSKVNEVTDFWSVGIQYQGLIPDRDEDVLALGFAQGIFSDQARAFTDDYESVLELYYSARIAPWLAISPSIQYIANPGGNQAVSDAVALAVRAQLTF